MARTPTLADAMRADPDRLARIARSLTGPRAEALVCIDESEPAPGCYATYQHKRVVHWLNEQGLVATTDGGCRLVTTHEGRRLANVVRVVRGQKGAA